jgi:hypothetical protein
MSLASESSAGDRPNAARVGLALRDGIPRASFGGELTWRTCGLLAEHLDAVLGTFRDRRVELDLTGVREIDPAGVAFLVRLRRVHARDRLAIIPGDRITHTVHYVARGERNRREGGRGTR